MEPEVAKKGPYAVELEAGKEYHWCACGKSKNQPFCDGSHHGTEFKPVVFTPEKAGKYFLCGCKHSQNKPFCDGAHVSVSEYAQGIRIGNNVWIACNVVVCDGVTIGDNAVIGAGSVVTRNIPANYVAYGSPCKPVRPITPDDSKMNLL